MKRYFSECPSTVFHTVFLITVNPLLNKPMMRFHLLFVSAIVLLGSCTGRSHKEEVSLEFEKYKLSNGLEVVLHRDTTDPIVAVAIQYHVGSNREKPGKTGFAHFFEHMLFQRSENLPRNAYFQKINDLGGDFNGGTWQDGTIYYEQVPRDALEKILWMESDRMGFFINTVTQAGLEREIDVVSNEKRQGENRPYGMANELLFKNLFPATHPYSWTVIGEIPDLRGATVEDVKEFYRKYYVPSNATLVVTGDFDTAQAKELVEKYFGEIPAAPKPELLSVQPAKLDSVKKVYYEDAFANAPMLRIAYSGVEMYHKDGYALDFLVDLLAGDKKSPLYQVLVEEKKLAPSVSMYSHQMELAGYINFNVTTFPDVKLDDVYAGIEEAYARFEQNGIDPKDLERYKNILETRTYGELTSVLGKALTMAQNNVFGGTPDRTLREVKRYNEVTVEDVKRVYDQYIKGKNYLAISIVPKGQGDLAITGSVPAAVNKESIEEQVITSKAGTITDEEDYERTGSIFDRSIEPALLVNTPALKVPAIWSTELSNGMKVKGILYTELPLIEFTIVLNEGMLLDNPVKAGVAYLTAAMLNEGTTLKTPSELEEAIGQLGASLRVSCSDESMSLTGRCLKKNFNPLMDLVEEMLTKPRWDEKAFEVQKERTLDRIRQDATKPGMIAYGLFKKVLYGEESILSKVTYGTRESVESITMEDLKAFYEANFSPASARMVFVGGFDGQEVGKTLASLSKNWPHKVVQHPLPGIPEPKPAAKVFFVDYPGASQSQIVVGKRAMPRNSSEAFPAEIVNEKLGAGSAGILFEVLRLQRGYTYGAYSNFMQGNLINNFQASSSVQGIATRESLGLFRDILKSYAQDYTQEYLDITRNSMLNSLNGSFETPGALRGMLYNIVVYGLPDDYVAQRQEVLKTFTLEEAKKCIEKNLNFDDMVIIVVGDARTQLENVKKLNLGTLLVVDKSGKPAK